MPGCYIGSPISNTQLSLFDHESAENKTTKHPHKIEITEMSLENSADVKGLPLVEYILRNKKNALTRLQGDGDFRSSECVKMLQEADIVVTNPPFSLFREYVSQLIAHDKKFLIIGNKNAITYKEIFKLVKENKIWIGRMPMGTDILFNVTAKYAKNFIENKKEGSAYRIENGIVKGRSQACWFTNIDHKKRHEKIELYKKYTTQEYPHYDNYGAIEVAKVAEIPEDWNGAMGVPITFLDKYNPEQFEIIALGNSRDNFTPNKEYKNPKKVLKNGKTANGEAINCVLTIKVNKQPIDTIYYLDGKNFLVAPYARILIKRKQ